MSESTAPRTAAATSGGTGPGGTDPRGTDPVSRRARLRDLLGLTEDERASAGTARLVPAPDLAAPTGTEGVRVHVGDGDPAAPGAGPGATGEGIPALLLRPAPERATGAAVVLVAGHGNGIDDLVDAGDGYHHGLARSLADAGWTVLCPEMISFGRRRFPRSEDPAGFTPGENTCGIDAARFLLHGRPVMGRRVADAAAALAALRTVPGVDPGRVAVAGGSGGGAVALLLAAADESVPAALVATYFSSFAASLAAIRHCPCNIVPGLLPDLEMSDLAALVAPRPLVIEAGEQDHLFPIAATRKSFARLGPGWEGTVPPRLVVTPGGHHFVGEESVRHLAELLG